MEISYFQFHNNNKGFSFLELRTGKILTKIQVYCRFYEEQENLRLLIDNSHQEFTKIVNEGWSKRGTPLQCKGEHCKIKRSCSRWNEKHSIRGEYLEGIFYLDNECKFHIEKNANSSLRNDTMIYSKK